MITVILAGGYGRRLAPVTDHHAKSLLPVVDRPIIDWIIEKLPPSKILISTNKSFEDSFKKWIGNQPAPDEGGLAGRPIEIVSEETRSEEEKLGAAGGLLYTIQSKTISEPILLVNGDNIFDFSLNDVSDSNYAVNLLYDIKTKEEVKGKYGNVRVENGFIVEFLEKPHNPASSLVSTGIYYFPPSIFPFIREFYDSYRHDRDNMGSLLKWLIEKKKTKVKGIVKEGLWVDIGSRDSYIHANQIFSHQDSFISPSTKLVNSSVNSSVILKNCHISDSKLEGCVIDEDCFLKKVYLKDKIIGKGSRITSKE